MLPLTFEELVFISAADSHVAINDAGVKTARENPWRSDKETSLTTDSRVGKRFQKKTRCCICIRALKHTRSDSRILSITIVPLPTPSHGTNICRSCKISPVEKIKPAPLAS